MSIANEQLALLVDRYLDGVLTDEESAQLNAALLADEATRDRFVELMIGDRALAEAHRASVDRIPAATPARTASMGRALRFSFPFALAAAVLLTAAVVAVYVFVIHPQSEIRDPQSGKTIATLIDADTDVFVDDDIANPGSDYAAGTYAIESGNAEFMLSSRVSLALEGPTRLVVHSPGRASLIHGVATFRVPEEATGYTVRLPDDSMIVDLGTAFRIEVEDGDARLRVTEGRVAWTPPAPDAETMVVSAGRSARIVDGAVVLTDTAIFEDSFESPAFTTEILGKKKATSPIGWVGSSVVAGYGWEQRERISEGDGSFTTPFGEHAYAIRYTNAAITTAPDTITEPLTAGLTYTVTFHATSLLAEGDSTYIVELVALSAGDDRSDDEAGVVLASAEGRVTPNGMAESHRVVFIAEEDHARLGDAIAIRLRGVSKEAVAYDNIQLSIEPTTSTGSTRSATTRTPSPNERGDRSDKPRDSEGPSSEK